MFKYEPLFHSYMDPIPCRPSLAKNAKIPDSIQRHVKSEFVRSLCIVRYGKQTRYQYTQYGNVVVVHGMLATLRGRFYPYYRHKTRAQRRLKKSSCKEEGIEVGQSIERYIVHGTPPKHPFAQRVIYYLEQKRRHHIVVCELPVYCKALSCTTRADIITTDKHGKLWMWELKCGSPSKSRQGMLRAPYNRINNTILNQWELQRHYTTLALRDSGIPIAQSRILQVYHEYDRKTRKRLIKIKQRTPAAWIRVKRNKNPSVTKVTKQTTLV